MLKNALKYVVDHGLILKTVLLTVVAIASLELFVSNFLHGCRMSQSFQTFFDSNFLHGCRISQSFQTFFESTSLCCLKLFCFYPFGSAKLMQFVSV